MSTRSTIAVVHEDGTVSQVYCHYDGYLEYNGDILRKHYATRGSVEELVKLGHLSSLGTFIHPSGQHNFDCPEENVCVFYGRDRDETGTEPQVFESVKAFMKEFQSEEYNYLFRDGKWFVQSDGEFPVFTELTEAFEIIKAAAAE